MMCSFRNHLHLVWILAVVGLGAAPTASGQLVAIEWQLGHQDLTYSADLERTSAGQMARDRLFRRADLERRELTIDGHRLVVIVRLGEGLAWLSSPATQTFSRLALDHPLVTGYAPWPGEGEARLRVDGGQGHAAAGQSYKVAGVNVDGSLFDGRLWLADDGITMRHETHHQGESRTFALSNVDRRSQPLELFEIPAGYRRAGSARQLLAELGLPSLGEAGLASRGEAGGGSTLRGRVRSVEVDAGGVRVEGDLEVRVDLKAAADAVRSRFRAKATVIECSPGKECRCGWGSICTLRCPEGDCDLICGAQSICNFDCPGGDCRVICGNQSECHLACDAGGCDFDCGDLSTCDS